jgi:hypothetical protein
VEERARQFGLPETRAVGFQCTACTLFDRLVESVAANALHGDQVVHESNTLLLQNLSAAARVPDDKKTKSRAAGSTWGKRMLAALRGEFPKLVAYTICPETQPEQRARWAEQSARVLALFVHWFWAAPSSSALEYALPLAFDALESYSSHDTVALIGKSILGVCDR